MQDGLLDKGLAAEVGGDQRPPAAREGRSRVIYAPNSPPFGTVPMTDFSFYLSLRRGLAP